MSDTPFTRRFTEPPTGNGPLAGLRVSIKELLDVAGYPTPAGTVGLREAPAERDAPLVARLREAGAHLVGHTSMTQLVYSGLGVNPHTGSPDNPVRPGHIPGGSSSGGAVSVANGEADVAIGSDTGGSLRIPAAFCAIVGFKPTAAGVPREGCVALSPSLDSLGPMARTVADCARVWRVIAAREPQAATGRAALLLPANFGRDGLDEEVAHAFATALDAIAPHVDGIEEAALPVLDAYGTHPVWHYAAVESRAAHPDLWERRDRLDPRVASRMARADGVGAVDYAATLQARSRLIEGFRAALGEAVLVLPTVAIAPPAHADLAADENYDRLNLMALRNTSLANVMDGCSISLPIGRGRPVGLMLTAPGGADERLLALAARLQPVLETVA